MQTSTRATLLHPNTAKPLPASTTRPHRDDLGIELCRQGTRARLGMEEAVKGLHGTGCHELERRHKLSGGTTKPTAALCSSTSYSSQWAGGRPGPLELQTCPPYLDTQRTVALASHGNHRKKILHDLNKDMGKHEQDVFNIMG